YFQRLTAGSSHSVLNDETSRTLRFSQSTVPQRAYLRSERDVLSREAFILECNLRTSTHSHVETEVDHIAVFDDVFLAFDAQFPGILALGFTAVTQQVLPPDDLSFDEPALEVTVNHAGGFRCSRALTHRPCAHFFLPGGEVRLQTEQLVSGADHGVEAGLFETGTLQKLGAISGLEFGNLAF